MILLLLMCLAQGSPLAPDSPLSLGASMARMAAAVKSVVPPADNSQVEQAIGNAGLADASTQISSAQGDSLLDRIVRTLVGARLDAHFYTGMCARNYTSGCPNGYSKDSEENKCILGDATDASLPADCAAFVPGSVNGPDFSLRCKTQWPCGACTKSFKGCPEKFFEQDSVCYPTREYVGPCRQAMNFKTFKSSETKARWAASCYTDWPCDPE